MELAVPGTYDPNQPVIKIEHLQTNMQVITSKQRPRKLSIFGQSLRLSAVTLWYDSQCYVARAEKLVGLEKASVEVTQMTLLINVF